MRKIGLHLSGLALISSTIFFGSPAAALTNADCAQVSSGVTISAFASGSYCVVSFTAGSGTWTAPTGALDIDLLIVGGGGGGGAGGSRAGNACNVASSGTRAGGGGGGGGGGQVRETKLYVNTGQTIALNVGAGGTGGARGACRVAGSPGNSGETTNIGSESALGGGGGFGGTNLGEGGAGGASYDSNGNVLSGGTILNAGDCSGVAMTGCMAGAGGASSISSGSTPIDNGISSNGAPGSEGTTSNLYLGILGSGGGGGNRHGATAPGATRGGGAGGTNAGTGVVAGDGASGTANYGGGGGGGRGNGWDNNLSPQTNAGAGGTGGSGVIVLRYIPTFSITIPQPTISGQVFKGLNSTISLTVPVTGVVRFFVNGKRISNCKDRVTSGNAPNNVATCSWKPSVKGTARISVQLTPTSNSYSVGSTSTLIVNVASRATRR